MVVRSARHLEIGLVHGGPGRGGGGEAVSEEDASVTLEYHGNGVGQPRIQQTRVEVKRRRRQRGAKKPGRPSCGAWAASVSKDVGASGEVARRKESS